MKRSVVITGTSTGIGRAAALDLDRHGWTVFAAVRQAADAASLQAEASERLRPVLLDVTDAEAIARTADAVGAAVGAGGLDGLVNNAGIAAPGPLEVLPIARLRQQLEVNVTAQVAVTQAFLPLLRRGGGRIVNVGSVGGRSAMPFAGAYCASKFALEAISDALRMELHGSGVDVVLIEPGSIATPIWQKAVDTDLPAGAETLYGDRIGAIKRALGETATTGEAPETVAAVIREALTVDRPKTRYLVGVMARFRAALQWLPDRLRDALILRLIQMRGGQDG